MGALPRALLSIDRRRLNFAVAEIERVRTRSLGLRETTGRPHLLCELLKGTFNLRDAPTF
jgi:hypothetical protein